MSDHTPSVDEAAVTAERRSANQTIFRVGLPLGVSSFGEFALEAVAFIWIVSTVGADSPVASLFIGALLVASTLPRLLVSPYAGAMADTWGARRSLVLADLSRFVLVGAFAAYLYATGSSEDAAAAVPLVVVCFLVASASELLGPARAVAVRAGVTSVHRPRASSATLAIVTASSIATGGLAPLMFATWGLQPVLLVITGSFVVGAVLAQWLVVGKIGDPPQITEDESSSVHRGIAKAIGATLRVPPLRMVVIGVATYGVALGMMNSTLPQFLMGSVGLSEQEYGWVNASFAVGSFVGIAATPWLAKRMSSVTVYSLALGSLGCAYIGLSTASSFWSAFTLMAVVGATFAAFLVTESPIVMDAAPEGMVGRVFAVLGPVIAITSIAGAVVVNIIYQLVSSQDGSLMTAYRLVVAIAGAIIIIGGMVLVRKRITATRERQTKEV